ncbi:S-layer family protein, partial [Polynucleobacter sp. UK-Kesae-W10]|uniref:beta strand repeat-containing protein n=1 Tax=Polynucleobacter sp. UK-Kesae-W10 TaxID=1819738 RepID=UPI0021079F32
GITITGTYAKSTTITPTAFTTNGLVNSETITAISSATVNNANVAGNGTNYVTGITISGGTASMSNYAITTAYNATSGTTQNTATINAKALTVTGSTVANRAYDGTYAATVTGGSLVGVISGDTVTLTQAGNFGQTGVGNAIAVTANDSIAGTSAGNYSLTQPTLASANITKAALGITLTATYGASTTVTPTAFTTNGLVNSETITAISSATVNNANVAGNGTNYVTGITISGGTASMSNYAITAAYNTTAGTTQNTATINQLGLTVTGSTVANKNYDGSRTASVTGGSLVGVISGDTVTLTQAGTFSQAGAGNGLTVTATDTLGGGSAGNYSLTQPTLGTANIAKAALGITIAGTYNGSTSITPTAFTTNGLVNSETITAISSATVNSANVADNGTNYVTGITISGGTALMNNYAITAAYNTTAGTTQNTATINAKALTVTGSTVANKNYDGTRTATVTGGSLVGVVSGDTVSLTQAATFSQAGAGNGLTVTAADTIDGASVGNYSLTQPTLGTANIAKAALGITITGTYAKSTTITPTAFTTNGLVNSETITAISSATVNNA